MPLCNSEAINMWLVHFMMIKGHLYILYYIYYIS